AVPTTAAVLATGRPMTPRRAMRARRNGMSGSFTLVRLLGLDGGEDGLDRDPPVGDQLAAGAAGRGSERRGPAVLPDEDAGGGSGLHRLGQIDDVLGREELSELGLDSPKLVDRVQIVDLDRIDGALAVLGQDQEVEHPDGPRLDEAGKLACHLTAEVAVPSRKLDHEVVHGAE